MGTLLLGASALAPRPAAASSASALELVRSARAAEANNDEARALRRYTDALGLDPTCEEAYLGLGALRVRRGDLREAERVYSVALAHLPQSRVATLERARVRWTLGAREEAAHDIEAAAVDDPPVLKELAVWYGELGQAPAQLAVWRRILVFAQAHGESPLLTEARLTVRALQILVDHADPVVAPGAGTTLRRLARDVARRSGG